MLPLAENLQTFPESLPKALEKRLLVLIIMISSAI